MTGDEAFVPLAVDLTEAVYPQPSKSISAVLMLVEMIHHISVTGILINAQNKRRFAAAHFDSTDMKGGDVCPYEASSSRACDSAQGYLWAGTWLVAALSVEKQQPLIPSLTFLCAALPAQKASLIKSARSAATVAIRRLFVYMLCLRSRPSTHAVMGLWGIFSH